MRNLKKITVLLVMMISGYISGQSLTNDVQLINAVERDSIVSKIHRGDYYKERLQLADELICQADLTIQAAKNVIKQQDTSIVNLTLAVNLLKENQKKTDELRKKEIKKQKQKKVLAFFKGFTIAALLQLFI